MKKKTMAFGGLLMAVAMTGYSVAGTYAKYVSKLDFTDEARIAKWELSAKQGGTCTLNDGVYKCDPLTDGQQIDLFAKSYTLATADNGKNVYVQSINGDRVVAPGTAGKYGIRFGGAMEVRHTFDINFALAENNPEFAIWYKIDNGVLDIKDTETTGYAKYSPIKYTIDLYHTIEKDGDKNYHESYLKLEDKTLDEIQTELTNWKTSADNNFAPGRLDLALDISWKWDTITEVTNETGDKILNDDQVNELDTYLGREWSKSMHPYSVDGKPENNFGSKSTFNIGVVATQIAEDYSQNPDAKLKVN